MPDTEAKKKSRQKWIENNYQFHLDLHNLYTKAYYIEHRDEVLAKKKEYYQKKKVEILAKMKDKYQQKKAAQMEEVAEAAETLGEI
jgi:predicted transcriptional regulator